METSQSFKRGGMVPVSPARTPRSSDRAVRDFRATDTNSNGKQDREKGVNVQVIVRCRPLSDEEQRLHTPVVVSCNESRREVAVAQNIANKQIDRTFAFDKVFGPSSKQRDVYNQAVSSIVNEVLEGYNCTIFAYGQTGTGKTYTMEGESKKKNGSMPSEAGVIPRAVQQIFDILEAQCAEYSMKVTFLELYNEEITDLLAVEESSKHVDDKAKKPLALMEDGKGGVLVRGLEEEIVCTANEIYKILEKGSAKRRTAETLLNKQSSRSHSVFSITIHIKEGTLEGEDVIKCGKLNLVDLAGSENVTRSGVRDGRAREAGEINKSLLTLGRCINSLVEHSGHVPYRDSKLTRLLRDSLGGKTKTCIIATISPSIHCLDETLSTLDYAHRAKNIRNKPEVNQKMLKSAMIKDLYSEIDKLKQEVFAAREKNGVYIPRDRYLQDEAEKKAMVEKIERLELESEFKDKQIEELQERHNSQQAMATELSEKLGKTEKKLAETDFALADLQQKHRQATATIIEKEYLIQNLLKSEKALIEQTFELREELQSAASDVSALFTKIERKDKIEDGNQALIQRFQTQLVEQLEILHQTLTTSITKQEQQLKDMEENMQSFVTMKAETTEELRGRVGKLRSMCSSGIQALDNIAWKVDENLKSSFKDLSSDLIKHSSSLQDLFKRISSEGDALLNSLESDLHNEEEMLNAFAQRQHEAHDRAAEATRSISGVAEKFFENVDAHTSNVTRIVEETQTVHSRKLAELENKFAECAASEEQLLVEKVAELFAVSNARKKKLIHESVYDISESVVEGASKLQQESFAIQKSSSFTKSKWRAHMVNTERHNLEDTSAIEKERENLAKAIKNCIGKVKLGSEQWRSAEDSLMDVEKQNASSISSVIRKCEESSQSLRTKFTSTASSVNDDMDVANKGLLATIDHSLKLDHDAHDAFDSLIVPTWEDLREMKNGHYNEVTNITDQSTKCLLQEYKVDEPSCATPKKRPYNLPAAISIEQLRTPPLDELTKSFREAKSGGNKLLANGHNSPQSLRDPRAPLIAIN
uniref:Kinesin motor domain-containing protein n=1 Tax=Kalanchoe fedtschenkoi TaxID=63787 RepID=A0A7N0UAG1_KALFE